MPFLEMKKTTLLALLFLSACSPTPSQLLDSVVRKHCAREYKCCTEDKRRHETLEQCHVQTRKLFPYGVHEDRALEYLAIDAPCSQEQDDGRKRRNLFSVLGKSPVVVTKLGYACRSDSQCPTLYDKDWNWKGQSTCSCAFENIDPKTGKCDITRTCIVPAKHLQVCTNGAHRIVCDSSSHCAVFDGDNVGRCVIRKKEGELCKSSRECEVGLSCNRRKCEPTKSACYL